MDPQTPPLPAVAPKSLVTLKTADPADKVLWVTEDEQTVIKMVNEAETRLITFTRVKGMKPSPYSTRPDNVANVEPA